MGKILITFILTIIGASLITGCNSTGCLENQNSVPLAGFYTSSTKKAIAIDSISIGGVGAPSDTLIIDNGLGVSQVYLPFRSSKESTSFYIHYNQEALDFDALNDTITFDYESIPYFVSEECGAMYFYSIKKVEYTRHIIDSVGLLDSMVKNTDIERIRIYFRTSEPAE